MAYAQTMSRYNRWMNERLYAHCGALPEAERKADRGAFFRSIHGTLNHILLADRIWLARFLGREFRFESLGQELCAEFAELERERAHTDAEIAAWVGGLTAERLAAPLVYTSVVSPQKRAYPLWLTVVHFFNHQTHHRGQLTTLLSQAGVDPGVTDLIWLPGVQLPT